MKAMQASYVERSHSGGYPPIDTISSSQLRIRRAWGEINGLLWTTFISFQHALLGSIAIVVFSQKASEGWSSWSYMAVDVPGY